MKPNTNGWRSWLDEQIWQAYNEAKGVAQMSTLTDSERADYVMLGSAKAIIELVLEDDQSERAVTAAQEWLEQYDERMKEGLAR